MTPPVPFREGHATVSVGLCFLWFVYGETLVPFHSQPRGLPLSCLRLQC